MKNKVVFFLSLFLAAGAALGQDAPTGIVRAGAISLLRAEGKSGATPATAIASTTDIFSVGFQKTDYTNYVPPPQGQITQIGPCFVIQLQQQPTTTPPVVTPLDAGPVVNLNGPNGSKQFPVNKFSYGGILGGGVSLNIPGLPPPAPLYLTPGTYTIDNGAGGADIGPFNATLTLPDPFFSWTNADDNPTIDRSAGVNLTWTGGNTDAKVYIQGVVSVFDPATFKLTGGGAFSCVVDYGDGHFFVSPDVMSALPATVPIPNIPTSTLSVSNGVQGTTDVPGSDVTSLGFLAGSSRSVVYQ